MKICEIVNQFGYTIIAQVIIYLTGVFLFGFWLLRTSLGRNALADSPPRQNNMPLYLPFIPLFIWFGAVSLALLVKNHLFSRLPDWQNALLDNLILCISAIAVIVVIIFLARATFANRLKGFGLNIKTIHKDILAALLNLTSVWPLMILMIMLTVFFGQLIWGQDFHLQQHEELKVITAHPQLSLRVLIIITSIVIMPAFEELLFRGLFQTMLRSFFDFRFSMLDSRNRAWLSILASSAIFATIHQTPSHWPALFALAICLGYAYEKSGSLFRPIFIHSIFNAVSIIAALYQ
jgi:membrane protease YdiL (CAAX protease family)